MSKPLEEILAPKPEARPRIYAYLIADKAHAGLLKVGQTTPVLSLSSPFEGAERVAAGRERRGRSSSRLHSLSSIRNGGEGRGEEGLGFMRMRAGRISPLPNPLPARASRGEGVESPELHGSRAAGPARASRGEGVRRSRSAPMSKPLEEILAPKPEARPRIYAYAIDDKAHAGLLKVGQTTPLPALSSPSEGAESVAAGREGRGRSSSRIHSLSSIRNGGEGRGEEGLVT